MECCAICLLGSGVLVGSGSSSCSSVHIFCYSCLWNKITQKTQFSTLSPDLLVYHLQCPVQDCKGEFRLRIDNERQWISDLKYFDELLYLKNCPFCFKSLKNKTV